MSRNKIFIAVFLVVILLSLVPSCAGGNRKSIKAVLEDYNNSPINIEPTSYDGGPKNTNFGVLLNFKID